MPNGKVYTRPQVQEPVNLEAVLTQACALDDDAPTNVVQLMRRHTDGTLTPYVVGPEGALLSDLQVMAVDTRGADIACYLFIANETAKKRLRGLATVKALTLTTAIGPKPALFEVSGVAISEDKPQRLAPGTTLWVGAAVAVAAGLIVTGTANEYAKAA